MRFPRRFRACTASGLIALLAALGTGLPSHHHDDGGAPDDRAGSLHSAEHHSHGTQLVDQERRTPAGSIEFLTPRPMAIGVIDVRREPVSAPRAMPFRPMERAPPSDSPRAPPFPA